MIKETQKSAPESHSVCILFWWFKQFSKNSSSSVKNTAHFYIFKFIITLPKVFIILQTNIILKSAKLPCQISVKGLFPPYAMQASSFYAVPKKLFYVGIYIKIWYPDCLKFKMCKKFLCCCTHENTVLPETPIAHQQH